MSSQVLSFIASYGRDSYIDCCKFTFYRGTKIGNEGLVLAAKIGPARLILGGTNFGMTGRSHGNEHQNSQTGSS